MKPRDTVNALTVTALGLGTLPVAPGTWASAGAMALYVLVWHVVPWPWDIAVLAVGIGVCMAAGAALCSWAEQHYARKDPRPFVLDEVAGQWLTCLLLSAVWGEGHVDWADFFAYVPLGIAFVLFRVMDVFKPFPIRRIERLPGWVGVMFDDLLAGVYAAAASWVVGYVLIVVFFPAI